MFNFLKRWTRTEHELAHENLSAFLDGQLSAREGSRVQRHLEECAACRADLEGLRHTVALLRAVPVLTPPRSFFLPASEAIRQGQVRRMRLSYLYLRAATAAATVLLILVVSGDVWLRYQPGKLAAPTVETRAVTTIVVAQPRPQEMPAAVTSEEPSAAVEANKMAAVAQGSPETASTIVPPQMLDTEGAKPTETIQAVAEGQVVAPQAFPSQTFARAAAPPPAPPLAEAVSTAPSPSAEPLATPVPTATPWPTPTPVPPTATPWPTPPPPTAMPSPQPTVEETRRSYPMPLPAPVGPRMFLVALRPSLSRLEWLLVLTVALLLAAMLWFRRRQRLV